MSHLRCKKTVKWKNTCSVNVFYSFGARDEPLFITISTQSNDAEHIPLEAHRRRCVGCRPEHHLPSLRGRRGLRPRGRGAVAQGKPSIRRLPRPRGPRRRDKEVPENACRRAQGLEQPAGHAGGGVDRAANLEGLHRRRGLPRRRGGLPRRRLPERALIKRARHNVRAMATSLCRAWCRSPSVRDCGGKKEATIKNAFLQLAGV